MKICTSEFNALLGENGEPTNFTIVIDRKIHDVKGWCPECGTLLKVNGDKLSPGNVIIGEYNPAHLIKSKE